MISATRSSLHVASLPVESVSVLEVLVSLLSSVRNIRLIAWAPRYAAKPVFEGHTIRTHAELRDLCWPGLQGVIMPLESRSVALSRWHCLSQRDSATHG